MKKLLPYLKNKYILTASIFLLYTMLLDDHDIFTMIRNNSKLNKIVTAKESTEKKLKETRSTLNKLSKKEEVERFAREKKFFKKDNEDIFVIFYEE